MKKIILILTLVALLFVTSCAYKTTHLQYIYKGENEKWTAEYKVNGSYKFFEVDGKTHYQGESDRVLVVEYKNDLSELSDIKQLVITYETSSGKGRTEIEFEDSLQPQKTYKIQSSRSSASIDENEIIKVIIEIDGVVESIELRKEKS